MNKIILQGENERASNVYYEVDNTQEPIGIGGMGQVFEGIRVDITTGSKIPVAIKFLFSDLPPRAVERSRREAMVMLHNDNVIRMYGFIETQSINEVGNPQKRYHVVSELLNGVTLEDLLQCKLLDRKGNVVRYAAELYDIYQKDPVRFAKIIMKNVLSGLMALHDLRYIHRDIDPSNIMITDDRHIKLIDFGICKSMDTLTTGDKSLTVSGRFMGKPHYASPELAVGDLVHQDYTTDIYAVGIMLYQCITGHVPFEGSLTEILDMQVHTQLPLKEINHSEMRHIIKKACEKNKFKRYQTAAEMRVDIESLDIKRASDSRRRKGLIAAILIVGIIVIGCIGGIIVHNNKVESERVTMMEHNYNDSILHVINNHVAEAQALSQKGANHDDDYAKYFIEAMHHFNQADSAKSQLNGVVASDYSAERENLINNLKDCKEYLERKIKDLEGEEEPELIRAVDNAKSYLKEINSLIN